MINYLFASFKSLLMPIPLFWILLGTFLGVIVGAIPGLSGSMLIVLTLPLTLYMDSVQAMNMLIGMYIGSISGGLITAILLRIPGTPSSIVTTFDGYPMAQAGQPGQALMLGVLSSFIGGFISWLILIMFAPILSRFALKFGSFEIFSMVMMALVLIASISQGSYLKALTSAMLGVLFSVPGIDPITGYVRLTFGVRKLNGGINLLPLLIGMFGMSQIIKDIGNLKLYVKSFESVKTKLKISLKDFFKYWPTLLRSSLIGTWIGILPGIGGNVGSIVAYTTEKNISKNPEKFGTGCAEGIIAAETANNATICGALIPFLTLGIPGSIITAILMGALILHGLVPGPLLMRQNPEIVYGIITASFVSNIMMVFLMVITIKVITKVVEMPKSLLIPIIIVFCFVGTYALNNRYFDVWVNDFINGKPEISIRLFETFAAIYLGHEALECTFQKECGKYITVEHNGTIYSCDFFVEDTWLLGSLDNEKSLEEILNSRKQTLFGEVKRKLDKRCLKCKWLKFCYGGCPKDRLRNPATKRFNPFCESIKMFFEHADEQFKEIIANLS
jgi:putative tricarboxylic transport membrane protein